jgi:glycosyltransferase involved in cell wall biosynthesis
MRVLLVPKWYPWPERPVFGIFCREHARAIAGEHDVVVLPSEAVRAPEFRAFSVSDQLEEGIRTIRVRYRRPRLRPAAVLFQLAGMISALRLLRREGWRPHIIHAHVYSAGVPALVLARLSGASVVVSEHYTGFQRGLITGYERLLARAVFRFADLVAPVSQDLGRQIRLLEPRAHIRQVDNVVDAAVFHPPLRRVDGDPPRLLTVAALAAKKGHADLLDALAILARERAVSLDVVGDGELREELRQRAQQLGLVQQVRFHGELPKAHVAAMMRESDLFVLPSLFENLPCVLIEAMASGLPSVATDVGGVSELSNGAGISLTSPGNPAALARTIASALDARGEVDTEALAEHARRRFGYDVVGRTWTEIYEQLRVRD